MTTPSTERPATAGGQSATPAPAAAVLMLARGGRAARAWLARHPTVRVATQMWLATRLLLVGLTWIGALFSPDQSNLPWGHATLSGQDFVAHWWVWDAGWYVLTAQQGYLNPAQYSYFPLYPLLIHLVTAALPWTDPLVVGMIISAVATLFAFVAIAKLAEIEGYSARSALRALAAYPFALYLFATYSEGVFLACAAWTLLAARRRWWPLAFVAGMLAGLSRPFGLALVLPVLWEFGRARGWWWALRQSWRDAGALKAALRRPGMWLAGTRGMLLAAGAPFGTGLYALYCWQRTGDPLIFIHANGHAIATIVDGVTLAARQATALPITSYPFARMAVDLVPLVGCSVFAMLTFRRIPVMWTLYLVGICGLCLTTPYVDAIFPDVYVSAGRYVLAAIPMFIVLGRWAERHPWVETLVIQGGWALQAIFLVFLFNGGWLV